MGADEFSTELSLVALRGGSVHTRAVAGKQGPRPTQQPDRTTEG